MNKYTWLSMGKGIAAVLIVALHTSPLLFISEKVNFVLTNIIARWAVPFFFITSGFLFALNWENKENYAYKYLKKLFLTYMFWIVIYTPHKVLYLYKNQTRVFSLEFVEELFFDIFYNGYYQHMWYVPALMVAILIVNWVLKSGNFKMATICAFVLYIVGIIGGMYANVRNNFIAKGILGVFKTTRNGVFFAFPLVLLGVFIHEIHKEYNNKIIYWAIGISIFINALEVFLVKSNNLSVEYSYGFTTFLVPTCVVLLATKKVNDCRNVLLDKLADFLQSYSMGVYYIHPLVIFVVMEIIELSNIEYRSVSMFVFLFAIVASIAIIGTMKRTLKNTKLNYFV